MDADHKADSFRLVRWFLEHRVPYDEAVKMVIETCKAAIPHPDWEKLQTLDHRKIRSDLTRSFETFVPKARNAAFTGLYFGFGTYGGGVNRSYKVQIGVTAVPIDRPMDTAWVDGLGYSEELSLESAELDSMAGIVRAENGLGSDAEYPLGLCVSATIANELVAMHATGLPELAAVAAGFGGDVLAMDLKRLRKSGF